MARTPTSIGSTYWRPSRTSRSFSPRSYHYALSGEVVPPLKKEADAAQQLPRRGAARRRDARREGLARVRERVDGRLQPDDLVEAGSRGNADAE